MGKRQNAVHFCWLFIKNSQTTRIHQCSAQVRVKIQMYFICLCKYQILEYDELIAWTDWHRNNVSHEKECCSNQYYPYHYEVINSYSVFLALYLLQMQEFSLKSFIVNKKSSNNFEYIDVKSILAELFSCITP